MPEKPTVELFMMTCRERTHTRNATLASLGGSDWRSDFTLVIDPDITTTTGPTRLVRNFRRTLSQAAKSSAAYVLITEDDIDFNEHIEHNVRSWAPSLKPGQLGTLYRTSASNKIGCQAIVMPIVEAQRLSLEAQQSKDKELWPTDAWLRRYAKVIAHTPSLVQHRDTSSTWGSPLAHRAAQFDPLWRAP